MIVACTECALPMIASSKNAFSIFNLSNGVNVGLGLSALIPPVYAVDSYEFDQFYANYIFSTELAFNQLVMIMLNEYMGYDSYILVDHDEYRDAITESLCKIIQQRYGYNVSIVNEPEDWEYIAESKFSIPGLYNLDIDKEKFILSTIDIDKAIQDAIKEDNRGGGSIGAI